MIEPMELQLNNLVLYEGHEVAIHELWNTDAILGDKAWSYVAPYKDLEPIPLTPELLERCGWLKYSDDCYLFKLNDSGMLRLVITFSCGDIITAISDIYSIQEKIIILSEAIQHLHQLQTLIKTLTGKELKIK